MLVEPKAAGGTLTNYTTHTLALLASASSRGSLRVDTLFVALDAGFNLMASNSKTADDRLQTIRLLASFSLVIWHDITIVT